jgi:hypothetical protein
VSRPEDLITKIAGIDWRELLVMSEEELFNRLSSDPLDGYERAVQILAVAVLNDRSELFRTVNAVANRLEPFAERAQAAQDR